MNATLCSDRSDAEKLAIAQTGGTLRDALCELIAEMVQKRNPLPLDELAGALRGVPEALICKALDELERASRVVFTATEGRVAIWPYAGEPFDPSSGYAAASG